MAFGMFFVSSQLWMATIMLMEKAGFDSSYAIIMMLLNGFGFGVAAYLDRQRR